MMKYSPLATRVLILGSMICSLCLLSACAGMMRWGVHTQQQQTILPVSHYAFETHGMAGEVEDYLSMAHSAAGPEKQGYLLSAAHLLVDAHEIRSASRILASIPLDVLTPVLAAQRNILMGRVALLQHRPHKALRYLRQIDRPARLSAIMQINQHQALALAYQQLRSPLNAVRQYIALDDLLMEDTSIEDNQQRNLSSVADGNCSRP